MIFWAASVHIMLSFIHHVEKCIMQNDSSLNMTFSILRWGSKLPFQSTGNEMGWIHIQNAIYPAPPRTHTSHTTAFGKYILKLKVTLFRKRAWEGDKPEEGSFCLTQYIIQLHFIKKNVPNFHRGQKYRTDVYPLPRVLWQCTKPRLTAFEYKHSFLNPSCVDWFRGRCPICCCRSSHPYLIPKNQTFCLYSLSLLHKSWLKSATDDRISVFLPSFDNWHTFWKITDKPH